MKVRILSDLHLESNYFYDYEYHGEDIVILGGDVASSVADISTFEDFIKSIPSNIHILFVPGNHEYYHGEFGSVNIFLYFIQDLYSNFNFMNNSQHILYNDGVYYSFFGGMMCSDFALYGTPEASSYNARTYINDFYRIKKRSRKWSLDDHVDMYAQFNDKFDRWVALTPKDYVKVCISHFLPSEKSVDKKFHKDPLNPYFCSNQEERIKRVDYWVHGHTHSNFDYYIDNTRVICNPHGYGRENKNFKNDLVIEI